MTASAVIQMVQRRSDFCSASVATRGISPYGGPFRASPSSVEELAGERRDVVVDRREVCRRGEEHDAEEAVLGARPEPGAVDAEDAGGAQQSEHVVLVVHA